MWFMSTILVAYSLPNDATIGSHQRRWHLLRGAHPEVIVTACTSGNPQRSLTWTSQHLACPALKNILYPVRSDTVSSWLTKNRCAIAEVGKALDAAAGAAGGRQPVYLAMGYIPALAIVANALHPVIFDYDDSMALYYRRRFSALKMSHPLKAINSMSWSISYRHFERWIIASSDATVITAESDALCLSRDATAAKMHVIGVGTDWLNHRPVSDYRQPANRLAFHGGFTWEPNRLAALYLGRKVMPRVRRVVANAELHIFGSPVFPELEEFNGRHGIKVHGYVDNLERHLSQADLYLMPMLTGSGVKNKLAEAMALGLPIVTNSLGAEGLPSKARTAVAISDGLDAFCERVISLLVHRECRMKLGMEARFAAERLFSWNDYATRYQQLIGSLARSESALGV